MKARRKHRLLDVFILCTAVFALLAAASGPCFAGEYGGLRFYIETGRVFVGYNDVQIPGDSGTRISLVDDLETGSDWFYRLRLVYAIKDRHNIMVLIAPLRLDADGQVNKPVVFEGVTFPAGARLSAGYRFDSYRIGYRYDFHRTSSLRVGAGFTAKIRDASVSLEGADLRSEKKNTGFVPLLNFRLAWMPTRSLTVLMEIEALGAPQGRAEDLLLALESRLSRNLSIRLGYRMLEGGADVEEVYNFALLNYAVVGLTLAL